MTITEESMLNMATRIKGWMHRGELSWLYQLAKVLPEGALWVEIGVWKGRSYTATALGLPPGSKLVGVDTFGGSVSRLATSCREATMPGDRVFQDFLRHREALENLRPDVELTWLRGPSHEMAEQIEDGTVDVCFIDGAHEPEPFLADLQAWPQKVKPGGVLAGHDFFNKDIKQKLQDCGIAVRKGPGSIWIAR